MSLKFVMYFDENYLFCFDHFSADNDHDNDNEMENKLYIHSIPG